MATLGYFNLVVDKQIFFMSADSACRQILHVLIFISGEVLDGFEF